jgi:hypothetical protein
VHHTHLLPHHQSVTITLVALLAVAAINPVHSQKGAKDQRDAEGLPFAARHKDDKGGLPFAARHKNDKKDEKPVVAVEGHDHDEMSVKSEVAIVETSVVDPSLEAEPVAVDESVDYHTSSDGEPNTEAEESVESVGTVDSIESVESVAAAPFAETLAGTGKSGKASANVGAMKASHTSKTHSQQDQQGYVPVAAVIFAVGLIGSVLHRRRNADQGEEGGAIQMANTYGSMQERFDMNATNVAAGSRSPLLTEATEPMLKKASVQVFEVLDRSEHVV